MYRGVHICSKLFVHIFRTEFKKDATEVGGESNRGPLFANPYLLPQECCDDVDEKRRHQGIYSLPRSYQLLKMFYTHIIHEQLPKQDRKSFNAILAYKGNPLRSVIRDYEISEQSYFSKKKCLLDKKNEPRSGFINRGNKNSEKVYDHFAEYQTDTMPSQWPLTFDKYVDAFNQQSSHLLKYLNQYQNVKIFDLREELNGQCKSNGKQMDLMMRNMSRVDPVLGDNDWRKIRQEIVEKVQPEEPLKSEMEDFTVVSGVVASADG